MILTGSCGQMSPAHLMSSQNRSLVLYSVVAFLTTCHAFDAFFLNLPASAGEGLPNHLPVHRVKREDTMPKLRDFEGDLEFLTAMELQHGLEFAVNHTTPQYMLDLYSSIETGQDKVRPSEEEREAIVDSDTVRSFKANLTESNGTSRANATREWLANFKMTSLSELQEQVRLAELRILLSRPWRDFMVEIALHHWAPAPCPHDPSLFDCLKKQLLTSRQLPTHRHDDYDGREVFDVTDGLRHWFTETPSLRGQYELEIRTVKNDQYPQDGGDSASGDVVMDDVILVVFSRASQPSSIIQDAQGSVKVRERRSSESASQALKHKKKKKKNRDRSQAEQERIVQEKLLRELFASRQESGPCRRVPMDVDFYNSGWARWIVYPKRFNAYRCAGRCTGALGSKDNPSNHAIMQNMVRVSRPESAPEPCCIPTRMSPLSMIYLEHGTIVMRHHEDMVVEECGCR